jgi:phenylalanyl-tRNA synthetase beta subunit
MYWEGRGIDVILDKPATDSAAATSVRLGHFGIIHPEVLGNYKLTLPTSSMELNVQALL